MEINSKVDELESLPDVNEVECLLEVNEVESWLEVDKAESLPEVDNDDGVVSRIKECLLNETQASDCDSS